LKGVTLIVAFSFLLHIWIIGLGGRNARASSRGAIRRAGDLPDVARTRPANGKSGGAPVTLTTVGPPGADGLANRSHAPQ
jgi:hypothetical protein